MKRREFIINSALAIGGTALLTGCVKEEIATIPEENKLPEVQAQVTEKINCINCNACLNDCPKKINIPEAFDLHNKYIATKDKTVYSKYSEMTDGRPEDCLKCGICTNNCPQNLQIPELLEQITNEYKNA